MFLFNFFYVWWDLIGSPVTKIILWCIQANAWIYTITGHCDALIVSGLKWMEMSEEPVSDQRLAPDAAHIHECICWNKNSRRRNLASRSPFSVLINLCHWCRWPNAGQFGVLQKQQQCFALRFVLINLVFFSEFLKRKNPSIVCLLLVNTGTAVQKHDV